MSDYTSAKDIATGSLVYIDGLATIKEAIQLMKQHNVGALIIAKRNEKDANGIITISDIVRGVHIPDKKPEEVSVYELMTKPVLSIPAHLNVRYVPRLMINSNISFAPIEENGTYIGMVSLREIVFGTV